MRVKFTEICKRRILGFVVIVNENIVTAQYSWLDYKTLLM
jgi:hypothetical protein